MLVGRMFLGLRAWMRALAHRMTESMKADETSNEESPAAHDQEVARGLKEYCQFPHPQGFAVMVSGPWGSGKTHFIKELMDDLAPRGKERRTHKPLYVSLYGVGDPGEIGDQFFQQLHPLLSHKATRLVGAIVRAAAKATARVDVGHDTQLSGGLLPDMDLSSMLTRADGRIIIFDDFERATMSPIALLGHINPLVEHDGCKVIILSDESKVGGQEEYRERKEKTIGRTFEFRADTGAAFAAFMDLIDDPDARSFFTQSRETVLKVFNDSGLDNLRLLKQFMWDFERLWKTLTREQRNHKEAMRELVSLLCASAIELRSGRLTAETFRRNDVLHNMRLRADKPDEASQAAEDVFNRYPTVRFESTMLDTDTIVELVLKSKLLMVRVQQQLKLHPYFAKPAEMPSWRALWLSSELPIEDHDAIVKRFEEDFDCREFRHEAEVYHVIGLSLWLSELGFPSWEAAVLVEKVKQYIADIYAAAASPDEMRTPTLERDKDGAFGLGYRNIQDPRFHELMQFHVQQREAWQRRAYPAIASDLHKLMTENSEAFLRDVCVTNGGPSRFARRGVLKHIPADQFAATIAHARYQDQNHVMRGLASRYQQVMAARELEEEVPWLKEVQQHLQSLGKNLPRIAWSNLSVLIREYVDKTLIEVDARLRAKPVSPHA